MRSFRPRARSMAVRVMSWLTARCGGCSMVIWRSQLVTVMAQVGLASSEADVARGAIGEGLRDPNWDATPAQ